MTTSRWLLYIVRNPQYCAKYDATGLCAAELNIENEIFSVESSSCHQSRYLLFCRGQHAIFLLRTCGTPIFPHSTNGQLNELLASS